MEKRGGGCAISKRRFGGIFILFIFFVPIFSPIIYKVHKTYKNSEVVSAIISDIAGGNRQIKVTYRYEIMGRKYETVKKESPTDLKIGDKKKIRVSTVRPEEVLDCMSEGERILPVILSAVVAFAMLCIEMIII